MKIYLLLIDHARFFFYSDESETSHVPEDSSTPPRTGVHAWFRARYDKFKSAWENADSGALLWMRRAWDWMHSWAHPDEAMLARLWSARQVDLHHPATRSSANIQTIWSDYLRRQEEAHLLWFIVNAVIAPFSATLAILPGPNLIGYWFAYRAIHHLLVLWGIQRVLRNRVSTELHPIAALDLPIECDDDGKISHGAITGAAAGLAEHVIWHRSSRHARVEGKAPAETTPSESNPPIPR